MSKYPKALMAFLIAFLSVVTVVNAQADFEGITPTDNNPVTPEPVIEEEIPAQVLSERINNYRAEEQSKIQFTKDKYMMVLQDPSDPNLDEKLNALLVSARYHKLADLFYSYFQKISQVLDNIALSGTPSAEPEALILQVENQLRNLSAQIDEYDTAYDQESSLLLSETGDINEFRRSIYAVSENLKSEFSLTRTNLLNLILTLQ